MPIKLNKLDKQIKLDTLNKLIKLNKQNNQFLLNKHKYSNLSKFLIEIIMSSSNNFGVYHYSGEGQTSWYGFAKAIFESYKLPTRAIPISSSQHPTAAIRPKHSVLNMEKAKEVFNIQPPNWEISLKKVIKNI